MDREVAQARAQRKALLWSMQPVLPVWWSSCTPFLPAQPGGPSRTCPHPPIKVLAYAILCVGSQCAAHITTSARHRPTQQAKGGLIAICARLCCLQRAMAALADAGAMEAAAEHASGAGDHGSERPDVGATTIGDGNHRTADRGSSRDRKERKERRRSRSSSRRRRERRSRSRDRGRRSPSRDRHRRRYRHRCGAVCGLRRRSSVPRASQTPYVAQVQVPRQR